MRTSAVMATDDKRWRGKREALSLEYWVKLRVCQRHNLNSSRLGRIAGPSAAYAASRCRHIETIGRLQTSGQPVNSFYLGRFISITRSLLVFMAEFNNETPVALGYRWPAEWERQASVWLAWPRNPNTWPGHFEPVPAEFAQFVKLLAEYEPVNILAGGQEVMAQAMSLVGGIKNVALHDIPTNDSWCRDHGPTFLSSNPKSQNPNPKSRPPALIDWGYNAWGGKYPPYDLDNEVPQRIAELQDRRRFVPGIILEGGAIDGNGDGCILTTKSCLLNPNRNPQLDQANIERYLRDYLGAEQVLWLTGGEIGGDDTDGHIDQIARFVNPTTIVVSVCEDPNDENNLPTQQNLAELKQLTNQSGRSFEIVSLPLPKPLFCEGQRLPAGYCNFLIANGVVIVPQFGDPADEIAIQTLKPLFPDREIRGSRSLALVWGLGSFHCLSQQETVPVL
jgi:agmatine deiminase